MTITGTGLDTLLVDRPQEYCERVHHRLATEQVVWFTTVNSRGVAAPNPVWFYWDGARIVVAHDNRAHRLAHLRRNSGIVLHFDCGSHGRDIVVMEGKAELATTPDIGPDAGYLEKYRRPIDEMFGGVESFLQSHRALTFIEPTRLRGW